MIRVAIMHYHLQPGGVARVIGNHLQALDAVSDEAIEVLVLHGPGTATAPNEEWQSFERVRVQRREIAGLDYDSRHQVDDLALRREIESVLADAGFTPDNALLHIHNHALGKNAALTACVGTMADARWPMLLQVHDFCEDFRPSEYVHLRTRCPDTAWWYPQADQIHYAVLNRDRKSVV